MIRPTLLLLCVLSVISYQTEGSLLKLTEEDFTQALQEYPFLMVKFFAPWCGHCKHLAPVYLEVADALKASGSPVGIAEVDCTVHKNVCQKYSVRGYPTVMFFTKGAEEPVKYPAARKKETIIEWINEKSGFKPEPVAEAVEEKTDEVAIAPDVYQITDNLYTLTDVTFKKALDEFDYVFVKFYAPWCGHCKRLAPIYVDLAKKEARDNLIIAEVDCTVSKTVCSSNGIRGYPSLKFFVKGNQPIPYQSGRTEEAINNFIEENIAKLIPQEVPEPTPEPIPEEL